MLEHYKWKPKMIRRRDKSKYYRRSQRKVWSITSRKISTCMRNNKLKACWIKSTITRSREHLKCQKERTCSIRHQLNNLDSYHPKETHHNSTSLCWMNSYPPSHKVDWMRMRSTKRMTLKRKWIMTRTVTQLMIDTIFIYYIILLYLLNL